MYPRVMTLVLGEGVIMTEMNNTLSFRYALYSVEAAKDAGYCSGATDVKKS